MLRFREGENRIDGRWELRIGNLRKSERGVDTQETRSPKEIESQRGLQRKRERK